MWVVENPADIGAIAVMLKSHHSAIDGIGAAVAIAQLCGTEPDSPPPAAVELPDPVGSIQIVARGLMGLGLRPLRFASAVTDTLSTVVKTVQRARAGRTMAAPFAAPKTVFNSAFSSRRNLAFVDLALEDVKTVKDSFGVTVNDVIVAVCAGALRRYLSTHAELPAPSLVAAVPVAVHQLSNRPGRNQASWLFCRLETNVAEPAERMAAIARGTADAKAHNADMAPTLIQDWTQLIAPPFLKTAMRLAPMLPLPDRPAYNLLLSNVPGPQEQLYLMGARIRGLYPFGPLLAGSALNVTVMSLNGRIGVGVISCPDVVSDLWLLAAEFGPALSELIDAAAEHEPTVREMQ
jgi:WS/DGAT/MGAT family acyltransferase